VAEYTDDQIKLSNEVAALMTNYYSNLLGDVDLIHAFSHLKEKYKDIDLAGKIDIQTGLRFPADYKL
jgi:hypothetical protein